MNILSNTRKALLNNRITNKKVIYNKIISILEVLN